MRKWMLCLNTGSKWSLSLFLAVTLSRLSNVMMKYCYFKAKRYKYFILYILMMFLAYVRYIIILHRSLCYFCLTTKEQCIWGIWNRHDNLSNIDDILPRWITADAYRSHLVEQKHLFKMLLSFTSAFKEKEEWWFIATKMNYET